ncbi:pyruvate kinase PKM [Nephila pilipes]|uniref:Pyruvate kinase n=1 Tax=Nephila pilipes TaxID=299642 RepID=A0A8X6PPT5_NEPPI|nr:pyruvate kinase PKM [Nephila pilipes]
MLESMIEKPRPTRAESSDVANAILDSSDCIMLSAESAKGDYVITCIDVMNAISREAEAAFFHRHVFNDLLLNTTLPTDQETGIAIAAVTIAMKVMASAIIALSHTGR